MNGLQTFSRKTKAFIMMKMLCLPSNLILFTKGYDLIYDCFDLSNRDENGNVSIVYCYLSEVNNSIEIQDIEHVSYSFDIYLDLILSGWEKGRK